MVGVIAILHNLMDKYSGMQVHVSSDSLSRLWSVNRDLGEDRK